MVNVAALLTLTLAAAATARPKNSSPSLKSLVSSIKGVFAKYHDTQQIPFECVYVHHRHNVGGKHYVCVPLYATSLSATSVDTAKAVVKLKKLLGGNVYGNTLDQYMHLGKQDHLDAAAPYWSIEYGKGCQLPKGNTSQDVCLYVVIHPIS